MDTKIASKLNKEAIARGESHHWMDFYKLFDIRIKEHQTQTRLI